jgi:hypothetical protein
MLKTYKSVVKGSEAGTTQWVGLMDMTHYSPDADARGYILYFPVSCLEVWFGIRLYFRGPLQV